MKKNTLLSIIGVIIGGVAGFVYFYFFGCTNGCPLKSSALFMTGYGALLGLVALPTFSDIAIRLRNAKRLRRANDATPSSEE